MAFQPTGEEVQLAQVVTPPPSAETQVGRETTLPNTASTLPLIGLYGLMALGGALAIRMAARRVS